MIYQTLDDRLVGIAVVRQLQTKQRIADGTCPDMERLFIDESSTTLPGIETLVADYLVNHAYNNLTTLTERDTDRVRCKTMNKVRSTVQRVHHPREV